MTTNRTRGIRHWLRQRPAASRGSIAGFWLLIAAAAAGHARWGPLGGLAVVLAWMVALFGWYFTRGLIRGLRG